MGVVAGLYIYDVVVKKFTFAISYLVSSCFVYEISWEPVNGFAPNSH